MRPKKYAFICVISGCILVGLRCAASYHSQRLCKRSEAIYASVQNEDEIASAIKPPRKDVFFENSVTSVPLWLISKNLRASASSADNFFQ